MLDGQIPAIFCDCNIEFDAVVIWRVADGKITETWDITAINTVRVIT